MSTRFGLRMSYQPSSRFTISQDGAACPGRRSTDFDSAIAFLSRRCPQQPDECSLRVLTFCDICCEIEPEKAHGVHAPIACRPALRAYIRTLGAHCGRRLNSPRARSGSGVFASSADVSVSLTNCTRRTVARPARRHSTIHSANARLPFTICAETPCVRCPACSRTTFTPIWLGGRVHQTR